MKNPVIMLLGILIAAVGIPSGAAITDPAVSVPRGPLALQAVGVPFVDPAFDTTLRRLTGATTAGGFATQIYSQLQAFSADNAYVLLVENDAYVVRRMSDLGLVGGIDTSGWNAPRWQPALSHTLLSYDTNEDTDVTVQYTNADTALITDHYTLPAQYERVRSNQSFDELSHDGRWMAGMFTRNDGASVIIAVDLVDRVLGAVLSIPALYAGACQPDPTWGEIEPDWIGVSPLGNYLVVQWERDGTARCSGLETFDIRTGAFVGRVYDSHQHGDLGRTSDGREFFMTEEFSSPMDVNRPALAYRLLPGTATVSPPNFLLVLDWADGMHISCQGPEDVCLVSHGGWDGDGWTPFEHEEFLQYLDGSVLRLAHHRSTQCGYWVQPRGSLSRDGTLAIFASDWLAGTGSDSCGGGNDLGRGEAYIIAVDGRSCGNGTVEAGEDCDDGNMTSGDGCDANCTVTSCGNAVVSAGEQCDDGNTTSGDCCSATCQAEAAGGACGDGNTCNGDETCDGAGNCATGTALDCADGDLCTEDRCDAVLGCSNVDAPALTCDAPTRSAVKIATDGPQGNSLFWRWSSPTGDAGALGDPTNATTYALCIWDEVAGTAPRSMTLGLSAGSPWQSLRNGYLYKDAGQTAAGIGFLKVKTAPSGRTKIVLRAAGGNLPLPPPAAADRLFAQDPSVVVQLVSSQGGCWQASFSAARTNSAVRFDAKLP